ncbi:SGNH/GDSL hydrolase family protein [Paraburkholderia megapolitana]|uniref:Lysophospholipase L1 n=1 Tax=Paraburkholderia megapolitana TaxID=420953 RepID=A0A1I3VLQ8_9BURK|nr:GDSL-type esterase/lipase family protein [Paraburkholderia megapolitana]QDQ84746.1 hypothetical protein FNZ07_27175 [Paraburkholderia megapolitana]SFJ96082.1 Lysophospholipase L1 [Paraburkholderia megapolitana]
MFGLLSFRNACRREIHRRAVAVPIGALVLLTSLLSPQAHAQTGAPAMSCPAPSSAIATTTPTPRPTAWIEQQAAVQHDLAAHSYQVITLGDSIMQGWSETRLASATGMTVLNAGFGQDGTEHTLWRLRNFDWHAQAPRYVLLLIGTNDIGYPTCDIYWGIRTVVQTAHTVFPQARIVVTSILPRGTNLMGADDKIRAVNAALKEAAPSAGFALFDAHDAFECGHKTPCPLFIPDFNLHLTKDGYDLLTSQLKNFLAGAEQRPTQGNN